jgi:hypothetical protein
MGLWNKKLPEADFWTYLEKQDYAALTHLFNHGKKFKIPNIQDWIKQASWQKNYAQMFFLWRNGAPAPTPFIEEIFSRFKMGVHFETLEQEKQAEKNAALALVKADLSDFTSAQQIPIEEIVFYKTANDQMVETTYILSIRFAHYLQHGYVHAHTALAYTIYYAPPIVDGTLLTEDNFEGDESIYLFSSHNRVNLISLSFSKISNVQLNMRIELDFNFSLEGNGDEEILVLEKIIDLPL